MIANRKSDDQSKSQTSSSSSSSSVASYDSSHYALYVSDAMRDEMLQCIRQDKSMSQALDQFTARMKLPEAYRDLDINDFYKLIEALACFSRQDRFKEVKSIQVLRKYLVPQVYKTAIQENIYKILLEKAVCLLQNEYRTKVGLSSHLMQACHGVGKSTCMRIMTLISRIIFPDLLALYISYSDVNDLNASAYEPIDDLFYRVFADCGMERVSKKNGLDNLHDNQRKLLLLCDDLDAVYRLRAKYNENHFGWATTRLVGCEEVDNGSIAVLLTSSSEKFSEVLCRRDRRLAGEYPFPGHFSNSRKWRPVDLYHGHNPFSLKELASIASWTSTDSLLSPQQNYLKIMLFFVGNNLPSLGRYFMKEISLEDTRKLFDYNPVVEPLDALARLVLKEVILYFYEKNIALFKELRGSDTEVDLFKIQSGIQYETLKPIMPLEFNRIYDKVNTSHPGHLKGNDLDLLYIKRFIDLGYLSHHYSSHNALVPTSLLNVILAKHFFDDQASSSKSVIQQITGLDEGNFTKMLNQAFARASEASMTANPNNSSSLFQPAQHAPVDGKKEKTLALTMS